MTVGNSRRCPMAAEPGTTIALFGGELCGRCKHGSVGRPLYGLPRLCDACILYYMNQVAASTANNLATLEVPIEVLRLVPHEVALRRLVLPVKKAGETLTVILATDEADDRSTTPNPAAVEDVEFLTGLFVRVELGDPKAVRDAIERLYKDIKNAVFEEDDPADSSEDP